MEEKSKFCKHCGEKIAEDDILCTKCGRQVEDINKNNNQNIIINNTNNNNNNSDPRFNNPKNKWISILLLLCTGCGHKFYEGKIIMGIIYILTLGFLGIGIFIDFLILLGKPNPYYVI